MKIFLCYKWILLCLCIHLCFFLSAAYFGWFTIFFSSATLHLPDPKWGDIYRGIDFYQIPRGAWAVWHGGSFTGHPLKNVQVYAHGEVVNSNVYHPLFTLALGSILIQFSPHMAYAVWLWCKLPLSLAGVVYFYWSFRDYKYVQFASCILLINASIYIDLATGQYHFLLNLFLLVLLITLIKRYPAALSVFVYFLTLIVKPVGLLFLPALIVKRRWKIAIPAIALFALITWLFSGDPYYLNNLKNMILHPWHHPDIQIFTFDALLRYSTHWPDLAYTLIQYSILALILALINFRRIHISKAVFLMVVYFLCFYTLVYEYDWSTLAYVIAPCVVMCPSFQTRLSRIAILLTCLPSCFVFFNLLHIDIHAGSPGMIAWQPMVISKLVPLFLLCGSALASDIKPIFKHAKAFFFAIRKVNEHLGTFGEEPEEEPEPTIVL